MTTLTVGASGQDYTTLSAAVANAKPGDTIDLQPGTYTNDFPALINGLTIEGVGGIAKLVATNQPGNGKAILDVAGNTTLKNLDISGVTVPDGNGAGVRYEGGTLTIENTAIHNNQEGILGAADPNGTITINQSEIYDNGTSSGSTHNIYIGDIATFTLTNSYVHDANTGHEVKSRAENNVITNDRIEDNSGTASYEIDLPNGGNATISGDTIQKSANSGNRVSIAYGEEYVANSTVPEQKLNAGSTVTLSNNTFVSDQSGADAVWNATNATFNAAGNSIYNYSQIDKAGRVSSSGFTTTSNRPTLDTSSPVDQSAGASTPTPPPVTTPPVMTPPPAADTTPPSLSVTESAYGTSNLAMDTISGAVSDSGSGVAKVEVYDTFGGKTVDLGSAALTTGGFIFAASGLADGSHAFSAIATDEAGNASQAVSAGPALIVDTTAPSLTARESVSGTTTRTSDILSGTVSDSGSGVSGVDVFATSAGKTTALGAATLNGGTWTYTASKLAAGTYTFSAVGYDNAGNATASISAGPAVTVVAATPKPPAAPKIASISSAGRPFVLRGTAAANSTVTVTDKVGGTSRTIGTATTGSDGSWSITSQTIGTAAVNTFAATASNGAASTASAGSLILSSAGSDKLSGTTGKADVFAFISSFGNDFVRGFETTAAAGSNHDVIDLSNTAYRSFQQLQSKISGTSAAVIRLDPSNSITLSGVSAHALQASDFRFTDPAP